jgi:hypothetical protein
MAQEPVDEEQLIVGHPRDDPVSRVATSNTTAIDKADEDRQWRVVGPVYLFNDRESPAVVEAGRNVGRWRRLNSGPRREGRRDDA